MYNRGHDHPRILNIQCSFLSLEIWFGVQVTFQSGNNPSMAVLPTSLIIFCPNPHEHDMLITDKKAPALQHRHYSLTVGKDTNVLQTVRQGNIWGEQKHVNTTFSLKKVWSSGARPHPWAPMGWKFWDGAAPRTDMFVHGLHWQQPFLPGVSMRKQALYLQLFTNDKISENTGYPTEKNTRITLIM